MPVSMDQNFSTPEVSILPQPSTSTGQPIKTAKVLHLINGEHYAGAERVQDLLALRLPEFGFDVGLACLKPVRFPMMCRSKNAPIYRLEMQNRIDLRVVRWAVRIVQREGYTIIHAHTPRSAMVARLTSMVTGVPMVYHVHSPSTQDTTNKWRNYFNSVAERFCTSGAARVIAVSESLGQHAEKMMGFCPTKIRVVHNGVPVVEPRPQRCPPQGTWTLGTTALFRPRKGIEVLLDAIDLLCQRDVHVTLRAVGPFETPEYERTIKERVSKLQLTDRVEWTGFCQDVNSELGQMDLFVLPSLFGEGLPMVVLEAMAAGVPVVGTRVEGVPEAIRDGVEGVLAAPEDPADLARAIESVVRGQVDWNALRNAAMARHAAHFSDHAMAEGVANVYHEMLDAK